MLLSLVCFGILHDGLLHHILRRRCCCLSAYLNKHLPPLFTRDHQLDGLLSIHHSETQWILIIFASPLLLLLFLSFRFRNQSCLVIVHLWWSNHRSDFLRILFSFDHKPPFICHYLVANSRSVLHELFVSNSWFHPPPSVADGVIPTYVGHICQVWSIRSSSKWSLSPNRRIREPLAKRGFYSLDALYVANRFTHTDTL